MRCGEAAARRWFFRIVGGLTYVLVGSIILLLRLGPDLLGYNGGFAADMAATAFPVFLVFWVLLFPFFLLVGYAIHVVLVSMGFGDGDPDLR